MKRYVMIYLTMFLLAVSGLYAKTSIDFKTLGNLTKIDTVVQTQNYSIPYVSCDSLVLLVETRDTLVIESIIFQYGTDNGFTVSRDTLQDSLTIPHTAIRYLQIKQGSNQGKGFET